MAKRKDGKGGMGLLPGETGNIKVGGTGSTSGSTSGFKNLGNISAGYNQLRNKKRSVIKRYLGPYRKFQRKVPQPNFPNPPKSIFPIPNPRPGLPNEGFTKTLNPPTTEPMVKTKGVAGELLKGQFTRPMPPSIKEVPGLTIGGMATKALIPIPGIPGANYSDGSRNNVWYQGKLWPATDFWSKFGKSSIIKYGQQ